MKDTKSALIATLLISLTAAILIIVWRLHPAALVWYGWFFGVIGAVRTVIATYRWTAK
jgi:hypothetical protein